MRDPDAALEIGASQVTRHLTHPLQTGHFLNSALARRWVAEGRLVQFQLTSERRVDAERLPFVSHPLEWCDAQLSDAARLTLDLQKEAVAEGFDMKDASAWNVLFAGSRPVFCDLLSFELLTERKWWAAGQFARHFILPLAVLRVKGLPTRHAFQVSRDGMLPEHARKVLGMRRFLTRFWPAMAGAASETLPPARAGKARPVAIEAIRSYRSGLHETFSWMLDGGAPRRPSASTWSGYREHRDHYPDGSVDRKREVLQRWLSEQKPAWVLDLGCNTGEFSRLSADSGASVVSIDGDHDAIQTLYRSLDHTSRIHPLIAPLDDMSGGRGWEGREHSGLMQRLWGQFDGVLMLALVHHLMVSSAIPIAEVAAMVRRCTRAWAVIEWIDENDPQMKLLCAQRRREPAHFSMDIQRNAFIDAGFELVEEIQLDPGTRRLALLRLKA